MSRRRSVAADVAAVVAGFLVLAMAAACGGGSGSKHGAGSSSAAKSSSLHGMLPTPPPHTPSFTLTDTAGHRFDFAQQTAGKLTYLYFGYTHCPDACPTTMAAIATALRRQPASVRRSVAVVFVTTDPRRDSRKVLRAWLDRFSPDFIGLTGTQVQIQGAEAASGVPLAAPEPSNRKGQYAVQHSAQVFAFSPDGIAHVFYLDGNTPSDYAADMPVLLRFA